MKTRKRISLEARALTACRIALYDLTSGDRSQTWADRAETISELRTVVYAENRKLARQKRLTETATHVHP